VQRTPVDPKSLRILLTGASTGLGLAASKRLLETDHRLVLTAREGSLHRFAEAGIAESERVRLVALDVTSKQQRWSAVEQTMTAFGGVDALINNAGISYRSVAEHVTQRELLLQMSVNFHAPMEMIRLVLPHMRWQRWGRILNVSSVGGMMAMPTMGAYSASKWALEGMSEALWYEVKPWNIRVSLIEPGFINSGGFENVRFTGQSREGLSRVSDPYFTHYATMSAFIAKIMRRTLATSDSVGKTIVRTLERKHPPLRVPATLDAHLFALLRRLLPRRLYHAVLYRSLPGIRRWGLRGDFVHLPQPRTRSGRTKLRKSHP